MWNRETARGNRNDWRAVLAALMVVFLLAACGASNTGGGAANTDTPNGETAEEAPNGETAEEAANAETAEEAPNAQTAEEAANAETAQEAPNGETAEEAADAQTTDTVSLQLGTSPFYMMVPASFQEGEMTQEDIDDDQVGYYYSDETKLDFDVYQFSKEGYPEALADFVTQEAAEYDAQEIVTDAEINGIPVACYRSVEESDGVDYNVITYAFENGGEYIEVVFWLDGDGADAQAAAMIATLSKN